MIAFACKCCLTAIELLFIATVFVVSRIYFLILLLIEVIKLKMKRIFYLPLSPINNVELPDCGDLEGWREFRIQNLEKINSDKLLTLGKEIQNVLKSRGNIIEEENDQDQKVELLRRQIEDALGECSMVNKKARPSVNLKNVVDDFEAMEKDGKLIAASKARELYQLIKAEEVDTLNDQKENIDNEDD